jgi:hypothetical protein
VWLAETSTSAVAVVVTVNEWVLLAETSTSAVAVCENALIVCDADALAPELAGAASNSAQVIRAISAISPP